MSPEVWIWPSLLGGLLVVAILHRIGMAFVVATTRAALHVWLRAEGLVPLGERRVRRPPFTPADDDGRSVLRFEARDRDGTTRHGWVWVGRWNERAIVHLA